MIAPTTTEEGVEDESAVSREHEVFTRPDGLVIIAGGKLTTYRRMAREAVGKTLDLLRELGDEPVNHKETTKHRPLPGVLHDVSLPKCGNKAAYQHCKINERYLAEADPAVRG